jgi:hypothetical protein
MASHQQQHQHDFEHEHEEVDKKRWLWIGVIVVALIGGGVFIALQRSRTATPPPAAAAAPAAPAKPAEELVLGRWPGKGHLNGNIESLIISNSQDYDRLHINASITGTELSVGKKKFVTGLGTHAKSRIVLGLKKEYKTFRGFCGVDDDAGTGGTVVFKIEGGGKMLFTSSLMKGSNAAKPFEVSVRDLDQVALIVEDGGDGIGFDHADWVDLSLL